MRKAKFGRGDIVRICLNPTAGREIQGDFRPVLVLSKTEFNALGMAMVAPIIQGGEFTRFAGFAVPLTGLGLKTQGVALVNMVRAVDLEARGAQRVETVPEVVMDDALARLQAICE